MLLRSLYYLRPAYERLYDCAKAVDALNTRDRTLQTDEKSIIRAFARTQRAIANTVARCYAVPAMQTGRRRVRDLIRRVCSCAAILRSEKKRGTKTIVPRKISDHRSSNQLRVTQLKLFN